MIYAAHSNDANCKRNKRRKEQHGNEIWIPRLSELKHNYRCVAPVNSHFAYTYLPFSALASGGANELKSRKNRIRLWDGLRWCLLCHLFNLFYYFFEWRTKWIHIPWIPFYYHHVSLATWIEEDFLLSFKGIGLLCDCIRNKNKSELKFCSLWHLTEKCTTNVANINLVKVN